jgi:hypothetical protein
MHNLRNTSGNEMGISSAVRKRTTINVVVGSRHIHLFVKFIEQPKLLGNFELRCLHGRFSCIRPVSNPEVNAGLCVAEREWFTLSVQSLPLVLLSSYRPMEGQTIELADQVVTVQTCIREVLGSNLGRDTDYPD